MGRSRRSMADINIVPYIDVMLVLLVIFMVTAPLLNQGVEVTLPKAPAHSLAVNDPEPIIISVNASGKIFLNIMNRPDTSIDIPVMVDQVKVARDQSTERPIMIKGDANTSYDNIVRVLASLQRANINSVGLVTNPEITE